MSDQLDDLIAFGDFDGEDEDPEDRVERCVMCGDPIPIEGFCCNDECLEAAAGVTGSSEPAWPAADAPIGTTTEDGAVTWSKAGKVKP